MFMILTNNFKYRLNNFDYFYSKSAIFQDKIRKDKILKM